MDTPDMHKPVNFTKPGKPIEKRDEKRMQGEFIIVCPYCRQPSKAKIRQRGVVVKGGGMIIQVGAWYECGRRECRAQFQLKKEHIVQIQVDDEGRLKEAGKEAQGRADSEPADGKKAIITCQCCGKEYTLTKEQFISRYCERSKVTPEELKEFGMSAHPCECGEECCEGWQMIHEDNIETFKKLGRLKPVDELAARTELADDPDKKDEKDGQSTT